MQIKINKHYIYMGTCKLLTLGTTCMPVAITWNEDEKQNDEAIVSRVIL